MSQQTTSSTSNINTSVEQVSDVYYKSPIPKRRLKLVGIGLAVFLITFIFNFPLSQRIKNLVQYEVLGQLNCPVSHEQIGTGFFPPRIQIKGLNFSRQCFDTPQDIHFGQVTFRLAFPSFVPPGPRFLLSLDYNNDPIRPFITPTYNGIHFNLRNAEFNHQFIAPLIGQEQFIRGDFLFNTIFTTSYSGGIPKSGNFQIKSTNFHIPSQNIQGFLVPTLNLNNLSLKARIDDSTLIVEEFITGDNASPVRAQFSGNINLNPTNLGMSELDLSGSFRLSEDFLKEFSFIQLFLQGAGQQDGSYSLVIRGTLDNPAPNFR